VGGAKFQEDFYMQISSLLKPGQIKLELEQQKRCTAINEVAQLLQPNPNVLNFPGFYEELLARERIESTCLGNEIAFPHARTDYLKGMVLAIGRSPQGVWFENCGQTVKLIFVIGTPKRMVTDYLSVVGGLARLLKDSSTREQLISAPSVEEFIAALTQAELAR
jgi:mannitol/fructose-specific phosphotransferase system IIA component (Ntr-type)